MQIWMQVLDNLCQGIFPHWRVVKNPLKEGGALWSRWGSAISCSDTVHEWLDLVKPQHTHLNLPSRRSSQDDCGIISESKVNHVCSSLCVQQRSEVEEEDASKGKAIIGNGSSEESLSLKKGAGSFGDLCLHLNNFWLSVSLGIIPAFCGCPSLQRSWSFHHPAGYLQPSGLQFSSCGQQEDELPLHWSQHSKGKGGEKSDLGLVCCPFLLWLWAATVNVSSPPGKMRTYSSGVTVVSLS